MAAEHYTAIPSRRNLVAVIAGLAGAVGLSVPFAKAEPQEPQDGDSLPPGVIMVPVEGDSMAPTFGPQDIAIVDTRQTDPFRPGVYAIRNGFGDTVIKRLAPVRDGSGIWVISDCKFHTDEAVKVADLHVVGRAIAVMRKVG